MARGNINKKRKNKKGLKILVVLICICVSVSVVFSYMFLKKLNVNSLGIKNTSKNLLATSNGTSSADDLKSKRKEIKENKSKYPKTLVDVAMEKDELVDFTYNYPEYAMNKESYKNKSISVEADYEKGKFPLFIQWDERWGYDKYGDDLMALNGCAPTVMAMVIVGLTGDTRVNPRVTAQYSLAHNYFVGDSGTSWEFIPSIAKEYGIKSTALEISAEVIKNNLLKGHPLVVSVKPGHFTKTGHFLLITGLTDDGKVIINDPFSKVRSNQTWDIDIFVKEAGAIWVMSK